jgi:hypothetical protein
MPPCAQRGAFYHWRVQTASSFTEAETCDKQIGCSDPAGLDHGYGVTGTLQGQGCRQPGNAASDHCNIHFEGVAKRRERRCSGRGHPQGETGAPSGRSLFAGAATAPRPDMLLRSCRFALFINCGLSRATAFVLSRRVRTCPAGCPAAARALK